MEAMSEYTDLTREQLETRLAAAEDVASLYGATASMARTDREKALYMLWRHWAHTFGDQVQRITDERVEQLARERDRIREETMARLYGSHT
jgi:hypothetical protein